MSTSIPEHDLVPVWLITGCSTGFGRELAKLVLEHGWFAVLTARNPESIADLEVSHQERTLALPLDVTNTLAIEAVVQKAEAKFRRIDVLVNNSGYGRCTVFGFGGPHLSAAYRRTLFYWLRRWRWGLNGLVGRSMRLRIGHPYGSITASGPRQPRARFSRFVLVAPLDFRPS